jgi:hypothetical protein
MIDAPHRLAASPEAPLSPQPFRHLPGYASDVADALRACEHAGLFRDGFAALTRHPSGVWRITIPGFARGLDHECLPVLLCWAGLVWSFLRGGPGATR